MKNISTELLAAESGASIAQATKVWQEMQLSGFRSWKPWAVLGVFQAGYWPLLLSGAAQEYGFPAKFLQSFLFIGGLLCSWILSRYIAYPRMVEEARRVVEDQR